MIKVAGNWEWGWNKPEFEIWQWNLLMRDFKVFEWYMWPITNTKNVEETVHLHEYETFQEILDVNQDIQHVYFEPQNMSQQPERGIDLRDFKHPKDVMYIFGSAHFNAVQRYKRPQDIHITITTIDNAGVLWPTQCLAMCFYDRLLKGWEGE